VPGDDINARYFLDRRRRPRLHECAVLFVDLLGIRLKATDRRRAGIHLRELSTALRGSVRDFLRTDSPWPAAFFSDTLVVAAPIEPGREESAVGGLLAQSSWLQCDLTLRGYFVRGALTVGKLHLHDGLLFGPALVEAYDLEMKRAHHPRIILGRRALDVMTQTLESYEEPASAPHNWELLRDQDGETFVDYLGSSIVDYVLDPAELGLEQHRDLLTERLEVHRRVRKTWEKYRWCAEYHNAVCDRFFGSSPQLRVPAEATTGAIQRFADP
jgi:hypothetical protein